MKKTIFTLVSALILFFSGLFVTNAQTARLQIIHNSADALVQNVDIFVNGAPFLQNVGFRQATPFLNVPAGVNLDIVLAPAGAGIGSGVGPFTVNLTQDETYLVIANGIVSATGYAPATPFGLNVYAMGREEANVATNTDVLVFHGSTDAPTVSVWETGVGAGQIISDFEFGDFSDYLPLATLDYTLEVRDATGTVTVAAYAAPLQTLGLDGAAITVIASGFLNPANNSDGPAFGLYVALASGGDLIPLPLIEEPTPTARLQIIHNSADAVVENVDIFVNGEPFLQNVGFRQATAFMDVPAGVNLDIVLAPAGAGIGSGVGPFTVNLTEGETYLVIANGIVSATGYAPATPFGLNVYAMGREEANVATNTDVLVFHGSTDAPTVSVWETGVGAGQIISDFEFGDFSDYLPLATLDYTLEVRDATGTVTVATYAAPLQTLGLQGAALTVVASGFLNPANNSNGPAFGLYVALASGGDLITLPVVTNIENKQAVVSQFRAYPNPATTVLNLDFFLSQNENVTVDMYSILGQKVKEAASGNMVSGTHQLKMDVSGLPQGIYFVNLKGSNFNETLKIKLVK